jgi:TonB family protein
MLSRLPHCRFVSSLRRRASILFVGLVIIGTSAVAQVTQPRPLNAPAAEYPEALRTSGREGQAIIRVTVSKMGLVTDAEVRSADDPAFGVAALVAVRQWTFTPATREGVPSASSIDVPFRFTVPLEDQLEARVGRKVFVEWNEPVIESSALRVRPSPKKPIVPVYPKELIGSGKSGEFKIDFVVTRQGQVINPTIPPEGTDALRLAALIAVAQADFSPVFHEGKVVNCRVSAVVRVREPKAAPKARTTPPPVSQRRRRDDI